MHPVGAELFNGDRQTDGRTDEHTDRHDEAKNPFYAVLRPSLKKEAIKTMSKEGESKKVIIYNHTKEIDSTG